MTDTRDEALHAPPLQGAADRALRELAEHSRSPHLAPLRAEHLLTERARLLGLTFHHRQSAGHCCRLLDARGGALALNLPRDEDWALLPAWLETAEHLTHWETVADMVRQRAADDLQERARVLGLAAAVAAEPPAQTLPFWRASGPPLLRGAPPDRRRPPRVVDLSALWAGPLCGQLLHLAGADVIKVESTDRPDGARQGNAAFYGLLNQGKRCVALDLRRAESRQALLALIRSADVVIEAARPRALRQLGIDASALLREHPHLTWVSITGYGRDEPKGNWVAFGDDAGAAAGLCQAMRRATGDLQFLGDAIADPLTGIHAAAAAWRSWCSGGGRLIALALADTAAASLAEALRDCGPDGLSQSLAAWWNIVRGRQPAPGQMRKAVGSVHAMGADTDAVLAEVGRSC